MPYRSASGGRQCIDLAEVDNIRIINGTVVYNSGVGRIVDYRRVLLYSWDIFGIAGAALDFKSTTGGIGGSGRGKDSEASEEEEDGEGQSRKGARHCH